MKQVEDYYAKLSKKLKYPARSVFKLKEIQEKYHILKRDNTVLDIGASPGSWSLYLLRELKIKGHITGVDLAEIPIDLEKYGNYTFLSGDILRENTIKTLRNSGPFDVILSDAAPSTSGNRGIDACRSLEIARSVFGLALGTLKKGGNLVIKVFQSEDVNDFLKNIRKMFFEAKTFKPKSSRNESREIFFVGIKFKPSNKKNT
ncbi:MAG: RlmE family RNA methyltransferase [Spirochaetes bacterium]|nr:RlmE family RNA methyltransferase [Spirochaetota bacterium]